MLARPRGVATPGTRSMKRWLLIVPLGIGLGLAAIGAWLVGTNLVGDEPFEEASAQGTIDSAALGERRSYLVRLPESYERDPQRRYPVVYVLDGSSQDLHTAASAALMARIAVVPEVIVV